MSDALPPPPAASADDPGPGPAGSGPSGGRGPRGTDRVPPHSLEAEVSVLGACLISENAVAATTELLQPDDFYRNAHRVVFEAIAELSKASEPVDAVSVTEWLSRRGRLEEVGGSTALYDLTEQVPTAANAAYYARIVRDRSLLRRLIDAGTQVAQLGYESEEDVTRTVDRAETLVFDLARTRTRSEVEPLKDLLNASYEKLEMLAKDRSEVTGLATGLDDCDRLTSGLQPQNLVIGAARPAMGKSGLALGISRYVAADLRRPVLFFSLEMSKVELANRLLSSEAKVDSGKLRTGRLEDRDWRAVGDALGRLNLAPLFIDDTPSISLMEIRAKARRLKQREKDLALIVVDYLQLMQTDGKRPESRVQEVAEMSRGLKMLAKEMDIPVIALSQLSRQPESRTDKRPMLSDLRESGAIEQDADIVAFIYRDEVYDSESADKGIAELIVAKHRNGATDNVRLAFLNHYATFANLAKGSRPPGGGAGGPGGPGGYGAAGAPAGPGGGMPAGVGGTSPV
ncbi:MAG: replicative DNA helicase [Nitriliruptoraceae bacterium]